MQSILNGLFHGVSGEKMKIEKIICDCCGEEVPKVKKKDIFGIEREYYRLGKLNYGYPFKDINCRDLGLDLCERCAGNISLGMCNTRMELISEYS